MGIYLPNMEMPKNCEACELAKHFDGYQENDCPFNAFSYYDCPLIPVPPHGRLGDLDELVRKIEHDRYNHTHTDGLAARHHIAEYGHFLKEIADIPTIIPAYKENADD